MRFQAASYARREFYHHQELFDEAFVFDLIISHHGGFPFSQYTNTPQLRPRIIVDNRTTEVN